MIKIETIDSLKANDELVDGLLKEGPAEVVIVDEFDQPVEEGGQLRRWCHVVTNGDREQHASEYLRQIGERVQPTAGGHARFYVRAEAHVAERLLSFHINAVVYVDHLDSREEPDISLESKVRDLLDMRKAHARGIVRTWVAGQVGRAVWVQDDATARLVPYFLSELQIVKDCICASMNRREDVVYPQGWTCPYHGFVRKGTENPSLCAEQERAGRLRQVEAV